MKYLFDEWRKIKGTLAGKNIFLFFDYDGTIASIANHPDKAVLSDNVKSILHKITLNPSFKVAVISGRTLADIKKRVGIKEIIYSGNHGLKIEGPLLKYENNVPESYKAVLSKIIKELRKAFTNFKNVFIEDKKLTLTLHYRLAGKEDFATIKKIFHKIISGYLVGKKIKVRKGKMIFEIVPPIDWNKGRAVLWILNRPEFAKNNFYPIYFGDDTTDEDAFRVLKNKGMTVMVGHREKSHAKYYLNDVSEVGQFSDQL